MNETRSPEQPTSDAGYRNPALTYQAQSEHQYEIPRTESGTPSAPGFEEGTDYSDVGGNPIQQQPGHPYAEISESRVTIPRVESGETSAQSSWAGIVHVTEYPDEPPWYVRRHSNEREEESD